MMFRSTFLGLVLCTTALPVAAQDFAFTQSCKLKLEACDMGRDGTEACPIGQEIAVDFWAEGSAFNLNVSGGAETGFGTGPATFALGQGYVADDLRVYYILGKDALDGVFWISVPDGTTGAQLNWGGQEDYFGGSCVPLE